MTDSWARPDTRLRASGTRFAPEPVQQPAPPWRLDAWAGLLTAIVTVLVGAPVGLLWAHLAPHVLVVAGEQVQVVETPGDAFIAADGYFLLAGLVAGVLGGVLAERLGAQHGPAVVLGLAVGGLAAAWVATAVGEMVGADQVRRLVAADAGASTDLAFRLRATPALIGWPVASLMSYLVLAVGRGLDRGASDAGTPDAAPSWG